MKRVQSASYFQGAAASPNASSGAASIPLPVRPANPSSAVLDIADRLADSPRIAREQLEVKSLKFCNIFVGFLVRGVRGRILIAGGKHFRAIHSFYCTVLVVRAMLQGDNRRLSFPRFYAKVLMLISQIRLSDKKRILRTVVCWRNGFVESLAVEAIPLT